MQVEQGIYFIKFLMMLQNSAVCTALCTIIKIGQKLKETIIHSDVADIKKSDSDIVG